MYPVLVQQAVQCCSNELEPRDFYGIPRLMAPSNPKYRSVNSLFAIMGSLLDDKISLLSNGCSGTSPVLVTDSTFTDITTCVGDVHRLNNVLARYRVHRLYGEMLIGARIDIDCRMIDVLDVDQFRKYCFH